MVVLKFGGKSLGDRKKFDKIANYIKSRAREEKLVVVVSAIADTTDKLIAYAKQYNSKKYSREHDALISCGEAVSAHLMALRLNSLGVKAVSLLGWQAGFFAEGEYGRCAISGIDRAPIEEKLKRFDCVIVAGFQAMNEGGDIVTLGRGGSDTSAVALGAAFKARVEIFSDFDGIFAGDPRNQNYKKYDSVDFDSACKYADTGAKVLSRSSTILARQNGVDLVCKCSAQPQKSGTKITAVSTPFIALNVKKGLCEITIISNNISFNLQKSVDFLLKSVKFHKIEIKQDKISVLIDEGELDTVEKRLAKLNNLLAEKRGKHQR